MRRTLVLSCLCVITIAAYWPAMHGPFVFDDWHYIQNSPAVTMQAPISITGERFITLTTLRLNYYFSGLNTFPYHLTSLAIHLLNGWLVFALACYFVEESGAFLAAALFLLHPMQSQAVIYLSQRSELLAATGILASCVFFLRRQWVLCALFTLFALGSKEIALILPLLWLALVVRTSERGALRRYAPKIGIGIAAILALPSIGRLLWSITQNYSTWPSKVYAIMALTSRWVFPLHQSIDHDFSLAQVFPIVGACICYAILAACGLLRSSKLYGFAILWFIILTIPHALGEPAGYFAEHHLYTPFFGFALLVSQCLTELSARSSFTNWPLSINARESAES